MRQCSATLRVTGPSQEHTPAGLLHREALPGRLDPRQDSDQTQPPPRAAGHSRAAPLPGPLGSCLGVSASEPSQAGEGEKGLRVITVRTRGCRPGGTGLRVPVCASLVLARERAEVTGSSRRRCLFSEGPPSAEGAAGPRSADGARGGSQSPKGGGGSLGLGAGISLHRDGGQTSPDKRKPS